MQSSPIIDDAPHRVSKKRRTQTDNFNILFVLSNRLFCACSFDRTANMIDSFIHFKERVGQKRKEKAERDYFRAFHPAKSFLSY